MVGTLLEKTRSKKTHRIFERVQTTSKALSAYTVAFAKRFD
jgi:hypothetical protein